MRGYKLIWVTVFTLSLAASFIPNKALAASSGWINAHELQRFSRRTLRRSTVPTSIACKNAKNTKGMSRKNTIVKVGYRSIRKKIKWTWAWGADVGRLKRKRAKQGYKIVSSGGFRRASGLYVPCVLWHRK